MNTRVSFVPVVLVLAITPPAYGQAAPAAQRDAQTERPVCKTHMQTGSRFKKRTCRTAKEWDELAERARRDGKEMLEQRSFLAQDKPG